MRLNLGIEKENLHIWDAVLLIINVNKSLVSIEILCIVDRAEELLKNEKKILSFTTNLRDGLIDWFVNSKLVQCAVRNNVWVSVRFAHFEGQSTYDVWVMLNVYISF